MLKIGQNWGKIANYSPNAQQRSAPPPDSWPVGKTVTRLSMESREPNVYRSGNKFFGDYIGHSVANGSHPLRHFEMSCIVREQ